MGFLFDSSEPLSAIAEAKLTRAGAMARVATMRQALEAAYDLRTKLRAACVVLDKLKRHHLDKIRSTEVQDKDIEAQIIRLTHRFKLREN